MATERQANFRKPGGASGWHSDLVHELHPAGYTHLHNDTVPPVGGDTLWASGYGAYEKLSPDFRKMIDGKKAVYRSGKASFFLLAFARRWEIPEYKSS
jgi:alpha-ketoglutarate-dependent taurine dioxygenase